MILLSVLSKFVVVLERLYLQVLKSRISEPINVIQVVMGSRQVGKTTDDEATTSLRVF